MTYFRLLKWLQSHLFNLHGLIFIKKQKRMAKKTFQIIVKAYASLEGPSKYTITLNSVHDYHDAVGQALFTIEHDVESYVRPEDAPLYYDAIISCGDMTLSEVLVHSKIFSKN